MISAICYSLAPAWRTHQVVAMNFSRAHDSLCDGDKVMDGKDGLTKRDFLQTIGAAGPTLRLLLGGTAAHMSAAAAPPEKFTPADCTPFFTASHDDLKGLMKRPAALTKELAGRQSFRGIPFLLGPGDPGQKRYVVLSTRRGPYLSASQPPTICITAYG